jgi:hypothetical protein
MQFEARQCRVGRDKPARGRRWDRDRARCIKRRQPDHVRQHVSDALGDFQAGSEEAVDVLAVLNISNEQNWRSQ